MRVSDLDGKRSGGVPEIIILDGDIEGEEGVKSV